MGFSGDIMYSLYRIPCPALDIALLSILLTTAHILRFGLWDVRSGSRSVRLPVRVLLSDFLSLRGLEHGSFN